MRVDVSDILSLSWLTGPIFGKELRVSSRRRRNYVLRSVYLGLLIVFLSLIWSQEIRSGSSLYVVSRMARAGQFIIAYIVWFQFLAVQLVALVSLSTAISDEIHHRTLASLMTTPISSFNIVTGKLLSKLLQVLLLMAISLPLLAIVRVFGGVPWGFVILSLSVTLGCVLFVGLFSLFFSIYCKRPYVVMIINLVCLGLFYGVVPLIAGYILCFSFDVSEDTFFKLLSIFNPYVLLAMETDRMISPSGGIPPSYWPGTLVFLFGCSGVLYFISVLMVRKVALLQATGQRRKRAAEIELEGKPDSAEAQGLWRRKIRPVTGPAVMWREMVRPVFGEHKRRFLIVICIALLLLLITYAIALAEDIIDEEGVHVFYTVVLLVLGMIFSIILPATCITSEKESQTWPVIMLTPLNESEILLGKFAGALRRIMPSYLFLIAHLLLFCVFGFIHPIALPQIGFIVTWVTFFLCGSGLYFSSLFRHTTTAVIMNFVLAATLWILIPIFLALLSEVTDIKDSLFEACLNANPVFQTVVVIDATATGGWELKRYHWGNFSLGMTGTSFLLINIAGLHILAGFLFVWRAKRRLRRDIL